MTNYNQTRETNNEINKYIFDVLNNKYKKDCPTAHKAVEELGYKIEKWNGVFHVTNPATKRTVFLDADGWGHKFICFNPYVNRCKITNKFDFINCLEKPVNPFTVEQHYLYRQTSKAIVKHYRLKSIKWDIDYHSDAIEQAKKNLDKALNDYKWAVEHHTERLIKSNDMLSEYKKEIGLVK